MADVVGLLKTRGEWTDAVTNGETSLTHKDWYEKEYLKKKKPVIADGEKKEKPTLASLAFD